MSSKAYLCPCVFSANVMLTFCQRQARKEIKTKETALKIDLQRSQRMFGATHMHTSFHYERNLR